ncbi:uncharacterized protein VP01_3013g6 [Puccinia sorghi]|uniref:Uncharacterized protein n=1 Tax=Puccinia sorghi TaxID=27349 RepID=A0A0L6V0B8_9BASI|nr:uncharacterized protein VP01_3013g6 [Puccinia sorghi]
MTQHSLSLVLYLDPKVTNLWHQGVKISTSVCNLLDIHKLIGCLIVPNNSSHFAIFKTTKSTHLAKAAGINKQSRDVGSNLKPGKMQTHILNLPYWNPIEFVVVELLHLLTGILEWHTRQVWCINEAAMEERSNGHSVSSPENDPGSNHSSQDSLWDQTFITAKNELIKYWYHAMVAELAMVYKQWMRYSFTLSYNFLPIKPTRISLSPFCNSQTSHAFPPPKTAAGFWTCKLSSLRHFEQINGILQNEPATKKLRTEFNILFISYNR